jgi:MbtH protein
MGLPMLQNLSLVIFRGICRLVDVGVEFSWGVWVMAIDEFKEIYTVLINHEEQYSLWLEYKPVPNGWRTAGKTGSKEECLEYVKSVWTDMRPLSLRQQGQAQVGNTILH